MSYYANKIQNTQRTPAKGSQAARKQSKSNPPAKTIKTSPRNKT